MTLPVPDVDPVARRYMSAREHRRAWLPEAVALGVLALVVTLVFDLSSLDIEAARVFYRPDAVDRWPFATQLPWSVLYRAAPWITASLVIAGFVALVAGLARQQDSLRRHAVFLILSVVIGPGLLINSVFKDHWDRPRPRDIVELGGPLQYVPAPLPGHEAGESFPCGHCSVGFLYGAGWWVWRRRRPALAWASLAGGIVAGLALGLGRIAAGGHFLSDIIWSALLAFGVCHILYYHALRLHRPKLTDSRLAATPWSHERWQRVSTLVAAIGGAGVLIALFATPHGTPLQAALSLSSLGRAPQVAEFEARTADFEIVLLDTPASQVSVEGELHGFGLPTSRLHAHFDFMLHPKPTLRYRIEQKGWFTDLNGVATVHLPVDGLERVVVRLKHGNIRVRDETRSGVVRSGVVTLDLETANGHVQAPERWRS
jgi:lipid A 4'-phosphatase